jgi:hypothetical protein
VLQHLGLKDDDEEGGIRLATDEEMIALRQQLQSYDKFMPAGWCLLQKGEGNRQVGIALAGAPESVSVASRGCSYWRNPNLNADA